MMRKTILSLIEYTTPMVFISNTNGPRLAPYLIAKKGRAVELLGEIV